jgi:dynein heavy chain
MNENPTLFCGPTGTGKSAYIKNLINNDLDQTKFLTLEIGFSAQTTCT